MPKTVSVAAQEEVSVWTARIEASENVVGIDENERNGYRDLHESEAPPMIEGAVSMRDAAPPGTRRAVLLNVLEVYCRRLQALLSDQSPQLTFDRERIYGSVIQDPSTGNVVMVPSPLMGLFADGVECLVQDVTERGGLPEEFRDAIDNLCTDGSVGIAVDIPTMPTADEVDQAGESPGEIQARAEQGDPSASRLQDHDANAPAIVQAIEAPLDPSDPLSPTAGEIEPEKAEAGYAAAEEQAKAGDEAHKQPRFVATGAIDFKRLPIKSSLLLCATATEARIPECFCLFRRIVVPRGEARGYASLRPEWVDALPLYSLSVDEKGHASLTEVEQDPGEPQDALLVEFYEVQDARYRVWHAIAKGSTEYGEVDEKSAYLNKRGESIFDNHFTVEVVAPYHIARDVPRRVYGIPLWRAGWDQQMLLVILDTAIAGLTMRIGRDVTLIHDGIQSGEREIIERGPPGSTVKLPMGVKADEAVGGIDYAAAVQSLIALRDLRETVLQDISVAMRFPLAEMTSRPVAKTARQEVLAQAGGEVASTDIAQQCEKAYGRCADRAWACVRKSWSDAMFWAYFPPDVAAACQAIPNFDWRETALNDLRLKARFAPQSRDNDPDKIAQIAGEVMPALAAAGYSLEPAARVLSRAAGLGAPQPAMAAVAPVGAAPGQEEGPGGGGRGAPQGGDKRPANRRGKGGRGQPAGAANHN